MTVLATVLLTAAICLLTWLLSVGISWVRYARRVNQYPGPRRRFLTSLLKTTSVPKNCLMEAADRQTKKYAPIFRSWVGFTGMVHLTRPEDVAVILSTMKCVNKPYFYQFLGELIGKGLITSSGKSWHAQREIITPTFSIKIINSYQQIFVQESEFLMKKLDRHAGKDAFDVTAYIMQYTLKGICGTAMGVSPQEQEEFYTLYVRASSELSDMALKQCMHPWLPWKLLSQLTADGRRFRRFMTLLDGFVDRVISESKRNLESANTINGEKDFVVDKPREVPFMRLLQQTENQLTDEDIRSQVKTIIAAGYETTMYAISWALFLLGSHKEVQGRVFEELDNIFHGSDRAVTVADLQKMKYLEQVIKETLRLYPVVPFIQRKIEEDVRIGKYVVPAGVVVNIHIHHLHRCADQFPDPETFNPDNFLPERVGSRHPFSYIPFSGGPRNCVGKRFSFHEQKTVLSYILRKYKVHSTQTIETIAPTRAITLRPGNGTWITIEQRI